MRKMNVSQSFFFRKYLPLSLLGRITRWQLFNSRTTRLINCHKNGRIVSVSHSRLIRAVSLFVLKNEAFPTYTAFNCVLSLKKSEVYFPLSALEMNCFTSWLKEWAILHAYCICWRKALFCLKARKTRCIFKSFALETSCFASRL